MRPCVAAGDHRRQREAQLVQQAGAATSTEQVRPPFAQHAAESALGQRVQCHAQVDVGIARDDRRPRPSRAATRSAPGDAAQVMTIGGTAVSVNSRAARSKSSDLLTTAIGGG